MRKSVLVIETPVDCEHCQCKYAFGECGVLHRTIENEGGEAGLVSAR